MARLVDMYCPQCGHTIDDHMLSMAHETEKLFCPRCCKVRSFHVVANGGVRGPRARVNDFPPPWSPYWEGHARTVATTEAYHEDDDGERPVQHKDGGAIKLDKDRSLERRDRYRHKQKLHRGQTPIYVDGGAK